jgi:hypothetical protein
MTAEGQLGLTLYLYSVLGASALAGTGRSESPTCSMPAPLTRALPVALGAERFCLDMWIFRLVCKKAL